MPRILLYKTGETAPALVDHVGDYLRWFQRIVGERAELVLHCARSVPRPDTRGWDGVVVTGSPCSLVDPEPWMEDAAGFVRDEAARGLPVLGVCFGHQLIGRAFGGVVRVNPRGWEAGTTEIELTDDGQRDPLFDGLPPRLAVNMSHRDEVWPLPPDVRRLATGAHCENQAIAVGDHVRGVQFHPEMTGVVIKRLIAHREPILRLDAEARGRGPDWDPRALLEQAGDTPAAERVLQNFIQHFIDHA